MSKKTDTGGAAFAAVESSGRYLSEGMTLLDYFAIHASEKDMGDMEAGYTYRVKRSVLRYDFAAAMIAEKRRREQ